jgi:NAD(P)-dependent dehydrogenase (short-subunit alcohol dehydrogenase family)
MNVSSKPFVVVTGASTGIGYACVEALIGSGRFVFGTVRKKADARHLKNVFGDDFAPLLFDVTDEDAIRRAVAVVEQRLAGGTLEGLVNNAGVALPGPLLYQPIDEFQRQFEINVTGQLRVIQAFAPLLGAGAVRNGPPGRIVNMSSVAGTIASPFVGAYAASKHALEGLSDALRRELMVFGVDVIVIEPGVIRTPIWEKAQEADFSRYDSTAYGASARRLLKWAEQHSLHGAPVELVAKAVLRALDARFPPPRIRVLPNYLTDWILPRIIPTRLLDWLIARRLKLLPAAKKPHGLSFDLTSIPLQLTKCRNSILDAMQKK